MPDFRAFTRSLPPSPGVYLFHGPSDEVIYVGKAISLKNRVSSYFQKSNQLSPAKKIMLTEIQRIEHIVVRTETEALLLESTMIKKFRPKYNIILKDDKYFQYIKIGLREDFPSVATVRRITLDGSRYFGPYTSGLAVRRTLRLLKRLFPYKSCENDADHPCFDAHLGRCLGHNTGPGSIERYRAVIKRLMEFLDGHVGSILQDLRRTMAAAAKARDFETAALTRDRLQALEHVLEKQTVITPRHESFDVLGLARDGALALVALFQVRQGKLVQRDLFPLQHTRDQQDDDVLSAFVGQFYSQSTNHPRSVYIGRNFHDLSGDGLQLDIRRAQRGLKRQLVEMAVENAADALRLEQIKGLNEDRRARLGLDELATALELPGRPKRIEMYDISNIQGRHPVGSMVVFVDGQPKKSQYRKFSIKTITGPDDVHMMAEMLRRRFQRRHDVAWPWPDLVLLDGGKPQLNTVLATVSEIPRDMPIAALAKQEEELFIPDRPTSVRLPEGSPGLHLVQRIRDEAHRFAIGFYRSKHGRAMTRSVLDDVPGLGPKMKKKLLDRFGTVQNIRAANDEDVAEILGEQATERLREYL